MKTLGFVLLAALFSASLSVAEQPLAGLRFKNAGTVRREMVFQYSNQPEFYLEDLEHWHIDKVSKYLYQLTDRGRVDPPVGMRSAVPLGGLGSGTLELRGDGSFQDWNIFDNSPASGNKIQLNDAFFGVRTKPGNGTAYVSTLRTQPPTGLPAVEQIEYAGAFPVSRLRFSDPKLPIAVDLYAYSDFRLRNADRSATPAALFTFLIRNPSKEAVQTSLVFLIPNYTRGQTGEGNFLLFRTEGTDSLGGTVAVRASGEGATIESGTASEVASLWQRFGNSGSVSGSTRDGASEYGAVSAQLTLQPSETREVTFVLAWYLPYQRYLDEMPGNYYTHLFANAGDVAHQALNRRVETWNNISLWQRSVFDNSLPAWLQDALINSVATMYKTGMRFADGRWRQWESFSCAGMEPEHIHFYRDLPYAFFFPDLQKPLLMAHAQFQTPDGFIQEQLSAGCTTPTSQLDVPSGRVMGDSATDFILECWQIWAWGGDRHYLDAIWPTAKKAAEWQMNRSKTYGLPKNLENTYDWWQFDKKDLVSYNAILHLASMRAAEKLAVVEGDQPFASECRQTFDVGQRSLYEHLWTGSYFRSWWTNGKDYPNSLHADTLYGQLWAFILNLGLTADAAKMKSHLAAEVEINGSQFGLLVMRRADPPDVEKQRDANRSAGGDHNSRVRDNLIWEAGSLDWGALNIYLGGEVQPSLAEAEKIVRNWNDHLHDEWNYTDITTPWDGYPWCNSHYTRQLIFWSIPLALSGQQWDAPAKRLRFDPRPGAPARLPFFTPDANGVIEPLSRGKWKLTVIAGKLDLEELQAGSEKWNGTISLGAGQSLAF